MKTEWFADWFDSNYYHILYQNRDLEEASSFIDRLIDFLDPKPNARMLDLACGKGRHSIHLAKKGYTVVGLDLSTESIKAARAFEMKDLSFYSHDMRLPFRINYFQYIFNFFTSFGYFETEKDHLDTLINIAKGLTKDGVFVIDFFNAHKVISELVHYETKKIDGLSFDIKRTLDKGYIKKDIHFEDNGKAYHFEEKVRAFMSNDFDRLLANAGLKIVHTFGDYDLSAFDEKTSSRLIIIAQKR